MSDAHRDEAALRLAALNQAVMVVVSHEANETEVLDLAQRMYDWLILPAPTAHLALELGAVTPQDENPQENIVQIHDDEQFTLSAQATDAKGFATTDTNLAWSVDNTAVISLQVAADNQSVTVVAGTPGSAVVTLTDSTGTINPATLAVDVVPAGAATITLTEGPVTKQPVATAPAPAPTDGTPAPAPADTTTTPATDTTSATPEAPAAAPTTENPAGTPAV